MSSPIVAPVRPAWSSRDASVVERDSVPSRGPLLEVVGGDLEVPLVTGSSQRYVNLDYAASAPALRSVADRVSEVLPYYASVHRGAGYASQVSTALYEEARETVAAFVGARRDDVTVFTRNTTDALNLLANAVPAGGEVVVLDIEHHANLLPWQRRSHRVVPCERTWRETAAALRADLQARPPALLAVTGSSNVTGEVVPLDEVVGIAHAAGARVVIDAAQLAPHRHIDLAAAGVDYLAFSGHKLYAPFGSGALIGRRDWLDAAPAYLAGGGAVTDVTVEASRWASAPERHEAGTPNVLGAVAMAAACDAIDALPEGALVRHERQLFEGLHDGLARVPGLRIARIWDDVADRIGLVTFSVEGIAPDLLAAALSAEHGIGVRDGRFCAHPLLERLGLAGGAVRASVGVGSRLDDIDRLVEAVRGIVTSGPSWSYATVSGRPVPSPDTRDGGRGGPLLQRAVGSPCQTP